MSFLSRDNARQADEPAIEIAAGTRLIPRITIQAFCEHSQTAQLVESAVHDRRMSKVALTTHNGGLDGAIETYRSNPTLTGSDSFAAESTACRFPASRKRPNSSTVPSKRRQVPTPFA